MAERYFIQAERYSGKSVKIQYYIDYFGIRETYNHGAGCQLPSGTELPAKIEFQNVSYKYCSNDNEKYALKNINLTIHKGEKLAVVGANGAGKTTLVKRLCGFYYPSEGAVRLNGRKVEEYNIEEYYTLFSAVFQDIYLLPISIKEFICSCNTNICQFYPEYFRILNCSHFRWDKMWRQNRNTIPH